MCMSHLSDKSASVRPWHINEAFPQTEAIACSDCESLSCIPLLFFLFPSPPSLPRLPFSHFTPSLALTIWWSSCLWATVPLVRGGQWLAPVQSIKSDMLFTLTWADPVTCAAWRRVTCGCAVDTETRRTGAPLNSKEANTYVQDWSLLYVQ